MNMKTTALTVGILLTSFAPPAITSAWAAPRLYVEIRGVQEGPQGKCGLKEQARGLLEKGLRERPEVTLDVGQPRPTGADLQRVLKSRKLIGYGLLLRITRCAHELLPPPKGKVYKLLMTDVAVAIDAEKIPSAQMALAGEGQANVGMEVSRVKEAELRQLLLEALTEATKQAVVRSVDKLAKPAGATKKRRKSRARRGARRRR